MGRAEAGQGALHLLLWRERGNGHKRPRIRLRLHPAEPHSLQRPGAEYDQRVGFRTDSRRRAERARRECGQQCGGAEENEEPERGADRSRLPVGEHGCGLSVPDGLNRFQKFETPLFTPTTKAEVGHDENMTMQEVEKLLGKDMAQRAKNVAMKLYQRGSELMRKRGLILIDTKYEFGLDDKGVLHVIDEVNTPDSSRLCTVEEWETKYPKIAAEMSTGKYKNVNEVLKARPDLKLKEFSSSMCATRCWRWASTQ